MDKTPYESSKFKRKVQKQRRNRGKKRKRRSYAALVDVGDISSDPSEGRSPISLSKVSGEEESTESTVGNPQTPEHITLPTKQPPPQPTTQKNSLGQIYDNDSGNESAFNDSLDSSDNLDDYEPGKEETIDQADEIYQELDGSPDQSEGAKAFCIVEYRWREGRPQFHVEWDTESKSLGGAKRS